MDLSDLAEDFGKQLFERIKANAKDEIDQLEVLIEENIRVAAADFAKLTLLALAGHDVSEEVAIVEAEILSWRFVGASVVVRAFNEAFSEALAFVGKVGLKVLKAAI